MALPFWCPSVQNLKRTSMPSFLLWLSTPAFGGLGPGRILSSGGGGVCRGAQRIPGCGSDSCVICNLWQVLPLCASPCLTLKRAELHPLGFYSPNEIVEVKALCKLVNTMMVVNPIISRDILQFGKRLELTYKTNAQKEWWNELINERTWLGITMKKNLRCWWGHNFRWGSWERTSLFPQISISHGSSTGAW